MNLTRAIWNAIATEQTTMPAQILAGNVDIDGSRITLLSFFTLLDTPVTNFNIVTP